MKILFLTRRFYPEIGGVEKHVLELSRELTKRGHEITIFSENYHSPDQSDTYTIKSDQPAKSSQIDTFSAQKIMVYRFNFGKNDWFQKFRVWAKLLSKINVIRDAEIVHCHDIFFWYLPFRFLFPRKKVFTTFHGYETKFPPTLKAKMVRKVSEELSFGNICVGDYIQRWYGTNPDYVTYGGVRKAQKSKKNGQERGRRPRILLLGRLEEDNGVKIYLGAFKRLKDRGISYSATVIGKGSYKSRFKKYTSVKGEIESLSNYIDRSDFLFASSYLSILEGLIRGKNVFSVYQNQLKEDYLKLSPFRNFVYLSSNTHSLVEQVLSALKSPYGSYNNQIRAIEWAKKQTWPKVANIYQKLWGI